MHMYMSYVYLCYTRVHKYLLIHIHICNIHMSMHTYTYAYCVHISMHIKHMFIYVCVHTYKDYIYSQFLERIIGQFCEEG